VYVRAQQKSDDLNLWATGKYSLCVVRNVETNKHSSRRSTRRDVERVESCRAKWNL